MRLDALIAVRGGVGVAATAERGFSSSVEKKKEESHRCKFSRTGEKAEDKSHFKLYYERFDSG